MENNNSCPFCSAEYPLPKQLYQHIKKRCAAEKDSKEREQAVIKLKQLKCNTYCATCNQNYGSAKRMKMHARIHKRPHTRPYEVCALLPNNFPEAQALAEQSTAAPSVVPPLQELAPSSLINLGDSSLAQLPPLPSSTSLGLAPDITEADCSNPVEKVKKRGLAQCWCGSSFTSGQEKKHRESSLHSVAVNKLKVNRRNAKYRMRFDGRLKDAEGRGLCFRAELYSVEKKCWVTPYVSTGHATPHKYYVRCTLKEGSNLYGLTFFADEKMHLPSPLKEPDEPKPNSRRKTRPTLYLFVDNARAHKSADYQKISAGGISSWVVYTAEGKILVQCNWLNGERLVSALIGGDENELLAAIALDDYERKK